MRHNRKEKLFTFVSTLQQEIVMSKYKEKVLCVQNNLAELLHLDDVIDEIFHLNFLTSEEYRSIKSNLDQYGSKRSAHEFLRILAFKGGNAITKPYGKKMGMFYIGRQNGFIKLRLLCDQSPKRFGNPAV